VSGEPAGRSTDPATDSATDPALARFLRSLAARDASPHTQRAYATAVGAYLGWLARRGTDWRHPGRADLRAYLSSFREPARAQAVSSLYRYYFRAFLDGARGRWRSKRLDVPTLMLFGADDLYVPPRLLRGYERYASEMEVELVPDSGHFVVDEKPDLVARRALAYLS